MKILLLTDGMYPYVMGGMQKHSYYLAKYLAQAEVEVHVVHCHHGKAGDIVREGADEKHFTSEELKHLKFSLLEFPKSIRLPGHYVRENWIYSNHIFNLTAKDSGSYDLIYAQGFSGWRYIKERQNGRVQTPIWVNFHGIEMFQAAPNWKVKLQHQLLRGPALWNMQNADKVFSFGAKIADVLKGIRIPDEKLVEMPIGIEDDWLSEPHSNNDIRRFVFVGRYERRKGIEELNQAIQSLRSQGETNFEVHFIGPIGREHQLKGADVKYHGPIYEQDKIKEILRSSDMLLCPSHSEGMPTVIMEGMASGLAILATDVGAVSKQIDQNGWLLSGPNVDEIVAAMQEAMHLDDEQLLEFKKKSNAIVREKFLWKNVVKNLIQAVEKNKEAAL